MHPTALNGAILLSILCAGSIHGAADPDRPRRAKSAIYNQPNGGGPADWQWGKQLFWDYADTSNLNSARREADNLSLSGVAPVMSAVGWVAAVRWGDTTLDTNTAFQWRDPAWKAYTRWTYAHDSLTPVGPDGNYLASFDNPLNSYWIPYTIPLDSVDCPAGMKRCTYGDFAADRIGRLCVRSHLAGIYAADFVDGLPGWILNQTSFHPRILKAFEDSTGIKLPEGPVSVKSNAILTRYMPEWADYWADSWGHFYANIAAHVRKAGRVEPLMSAQTAWDMPTRRLMGVDFRQYLRHLPSQNWFFAVEMQGDNLRPMRTIANQVNLFGTYTAWEPGMTMGAKINVNDQFLTESMLLAGMRVSESASMQRSQYLLVGFTHVATRSGKVRRATQAFEYGYYDNQSQVDPKATDFLLSHFPRRPYGPALFFSKAQLKTYENAQKPMLLLEQADAMWNTAPYGYFATEVVLDSLRPESRPSAWIVPSLDRLPTEERNKLLAHAPILSADSAAKTSPIRASGKAKAWGFWDHESSLVVLVTNPDSTLVSTTLSISGLAKGGWTHAYLGLKDSTRSVAISGTFSLPMAVGPYDTRAYVFKKDVPTGASRRAEGKASLPSKRIDGEVRGVQVLDPLNGRYRDIKGRLSLPQ